MLNTLLKVTNLKKYFKTSRGLLYAVDDISFSLGKGETLGVVGESGCGKSTLGRVILNLLDATDGTVEFDGKNITHLTGSALKQQRKEMQMIFQDPFASLNPRMTVADIIGEPLKIYNITTSKSEYEAKVLSLMEQVGLTKRLFHSYPHELDGGRRQRVGIARSLAVRV